jgi:hypothetical protein
MIFINVINQKVSIRIRYKLFIKKFHMLYLLNNVINLKMSNNTTY